MPGAPPPGGQVPGAAQLAPQATGPGGAPLADFGTRLGAWLLDALLYGLVVVPFVIVGVISIVAAFSDCVSFGDEIICPPGEPKGGLIALGIVIILVGALVSLTLFVRALARTGQPWGAKIVGVKVVRSESGDVLGVGRALGRSLFAYFLSGSICYLGYLWMLWDGRKQTWHDKVTDSVVIKV